MSNVRGIWCVVDDQLCGLCFVLWLQEKCMNLYKGARAYEFLVHSILSRTSSSVFYRPVYCCLSMYSGILDYELCSIFSSRPGKWQNCPKPFFCALVGAAFAFNLSLYCICPYNKLDVGQISLGIRCAILQVGWQDGPAEASSAFSTKNINRLTISMFILRD